MLLVKGLHALVQFMPCAFIVGDRISASVRDLRMEYRNILPPLSADAEMYRDRHIKKILTFWQRFGPYARALVVCAAILLTYGAYRFVADTAYDMLIGGIGREGYDEASAPAAWGFAASLPACLAFNWLLLAFVRRLARRTIWLDSFARTLGVMLVGIGVFFAGILIPILLYFALVPGISPDDAFSLFLATFAISNLVAGIAGVASSGVALALLLHRVLWPIVSRPVYALGRYGVIRRPKLLASAGLVLLTFAIPSVGTPLAGILSRLH